MSMKYNSTVGSVHIQLSTDRIDRNVLEAQKALNEQIVADSEKFIPFSNGALRSQVRFPKGIYGGEIEYYAPYAHYQYEGEVYGPNIPIKDAGGNLTGWWSPPSKQPTGRKLQYHTAGTSDHWFEKAKKENLNKWVQTVEKKVNGG